MQALTQSVISDETGPIHPEAAIRRLESPFGRVLAMSCLLLLPLPLPLQHQSVRVFERSR